MKYFLLVLVSIIFLFSCSSSKKKCDCDNVDDCLSKYKFEEARKYAAVADKKELIPTETRRVAYAEAEYWVNEKDFAKALPVAKEVGGEEYIKLLNEIITKKIEINQIDDIEIYYSSFPERPFEEGIKDIWDQGNTVTAANKIKYDLSIKIINSFCKRNDYEKAKSFLNTLPENLIISSLQKNLQDRDEKLYFTIKRQLKKNQEFYEPWQGYIPDYYHIVTYVYPRKEALKIIEEYKKEK